MVVQIQVEKLLVNDRIIIFLIQPGRRNVPKDGFTTLVLGILSAILNLQGTNWFVANIVMQVALRLTKRRSFLGTSPNGETSNLEQFLQSSRIKFMMSLTLMVKNHTNELLRVKGPRKENCCSKH